jgi:hypothetical protein
MRIYGAVQLQPKQIIAGGTYEDNEFFISFVASTSTASFYFKDLNQGRYGQFVNYIYAYTHTHAYVGGDSAVDIATR